MPTESKGIQPSRSAAGIARALTELVPVLVTLRIGSGDGLAYAGALRRMVRREVRQMKREWPAIL